MTIVVIGNFDGVHKGHQALLNKAAEIDPQVVVLTFEPHPRTYFAPDSDPYRITAAAMKTERLLQFGAEDVAALDFDAELAQLSAQEFIDHILIDHLQADHVLVGEDFMFGKDRSGDVDTLRSDGRFQTHIVPLISDTHGVLSSSAVRKFIKAGDMCSVNEVLGWDWEIRGLVQQGDQRGRELGYPTANIAMGQGICPAYGIYAVRIRIHGHIYGGVANIGIRPMFEVSQPLLEVHIFDFDEDIYGQEIDVLPVRKLRDEAKFDDLDALKRQMDVDAQEAKAELSYSKF